MRNDFIGLVLGGRYEIRELLGEGGLVQVFTAHDHTLDRRVVVKILLPRFRFTPGATDHLFRELCVIARLKHPHILIVYDQGIQTINGQTLVYLVMPLAGGGTLADRLKAKPLDADEAEPILKQVCDALDYAHREGVLHLDLKPSNILFDEQGNALIADFGLASLLQETSGIKVDTSDPIYTAPEQPLDGDTGPFSDVYTLGIILYQMLTGELPKRKLRGEGLFVRLGRPLPPGVRPVVKQAMHSDPQQRYRSAGALAEAFTAALYPLPSHLATLREALRQLGQYCEDNPAIVEQQMLTYAFEWAGLFTALGYGEPGKEELLEWESGSVVLYTLDHHVMAVIEFILPEQSVDEGLARLEQRYAAEPQPGVGALCNGRELWVYRHAERGLSPHPILHLSLKDAADADVQKAYEWLGRRKPKDQPCGALARRLLVLLVIVAPLLLLFTIGLVLVTWGKLPLRTLPTTTPTFSTPQHAISGDDLLSAVTPTPTFTPTPLPPTATPTFTLGPTSSPTPSPTPSPSSTPSSTPTPAPSPTSTPLPYLTVSEDRVNVYDGPGEGYGVLGQVHQGYRLRVLGCSKDRAWYQTDHLGWLGWIAVQATTANINCQNLPKVEEPPMPINHPPSIQEIQAASTSIEMWDSMRLTCWASDPNQDVLTYDWEASDGSIGGVGDSVIYYAPGSPGSQTIIVTVRDGHGGEAEHSILIQVVSAHPPPGMSEPVGAFGQAWREGQLHRTLGWAVGEEDEIYGAQQDFQHGTMFWRSDTDQIYALTDDGQWQDYVGTWQEGMDEYSCPGAGPYTPPTPKRGFGEIWCHQLGGLNAAIGLAETAEEGYYAYWQVFEHGFMWMGNDGKVYVFYEDKTWETPLNASPLALIIDGFESYDNDAALVEVYNVISYTPNVGELGLTSQPDVSSGNRGAAFYYQISGQDDNDYAGFQRTFDAQDWRGYSGLCVWIKREGGGMEMDLVIQFGEASGEVWRYRTDLSTFDVKDFCLLFNEDAFQWADWSAEENGRIDLDAVSYYGFFVGHGGQGSGWIYVDDIRLIQ